MSQEVKIPSVGESVVTGTISQWHQSDGAQVKPGDILLTLETDKISTEIEAETAGILRIRAQEGEEVEIGAVVAVIEAGQEAPAASTPQPAPTPAEPPTSTKSSGPELTTAPPNPLSTDPRSYSAAASPPPPPSPGASAPAAEPEAKPSLTVLPGSADEPASPPVTDASGRVTRKRMSPLRRKIASHLVNAQQTAAILTTFNECDMTNVMSLRKSIQDSFVAKHGVKLGFMSFFVKATVEALKAVPQINARVDGEDVIENHFYDVGVAIGTERGLIVPGIRDCDTKSFAQIEKDIITYATKAKEGKIELGDLQGGVFTISNGGIYGSMLSTPILNAPQSGILGMHNIMDRPIAVDGKVVVRPMMYLALSYDHRIVDGKEAVTFLKMIKDCIEEPGRLMLQL